jgi:hypothetical protein
MRLPERIEEQRQLNGTEVKKVRKDKGSDGLQKEHRGSASRQRVVRGLISGLAADPTSPPGQISKPQFPHYSQRATNWPTPTLARHRYNLPSFDF